MELVVLSEPVARNPVRLRWAAALAALVGAVGGPFFGYWPTVFGLASTGPTPLLAGDAAAAVFLLLAPIVGAVTAGLATVVIGKNGHEALSGFLGILASLVAVGAVQEAAAPLAQDWVSRFAANPSWAAVYGGAIAGGLAGFGLAGLLAVGRLGVRPEPRGGVFAAVLGSVGGLLAGLGGGSVGYSFAVMASACPNGSFSNPSLPTGQCPVGIALTSFLLGSWVGAGTGAILGLAAFALLRPLRGDIPQAPEEAGAPEESA